MKIIYSFILHIKLHLLKKFACFCGSNVPCDLVAIKLTLLTKLALALIALKGLNLLEQVKARNKPIIAL